MYRQILSTILILIVSTLLLAASQAMALTPTEAPQVQRDKADPPGGDFGFVPFSIDLPHLTGQLEPDSLRVIQAPSQWDWREQGKVTSVKNQSVCGSCYAFASLGNIESKMLIDGEGTFDFSENNAKECNWYQSSCGGSNYWNMADHYSKNGTVLEACDPYVAANVACNTGCAYIKTLLDWRVISTTSVPGTAILQDYIYTYGPVYASLYAGDGSNPSWESEFDSYDGSYTLYHTGAEATNHAVLIVGWDDDMPHAGGTGGWIVKNSWGTSWGGTCGYGAEGGYFKIAYGSASIGKYSSFIYDWQDHVADGELMYYDDGGYTSSYGYNNITGWGLCKFVPSSDAYVNQIEFWTNDATTDVDVYLYDDFNGSALSNLLATEPNNSYDEAGYHSVAISSPPEITGGDDVYAVVKFTNVTYGYPVVTDNSVPIESNKTYLSSSGTTGSWTELGAGYGNDIAIRIRTSPTLGVSADEFYEIKPGKYGLSDNYPNPFNSITTIEYELKTESHVDVSVYNILGQRVSTLVDETKSVGEHSTRWNGSDFEGDPVPTGIYFYRIEAGVFTETKKMLLLK